MPCGGDCTGIKTELKLNANSTYTLQSQALGQETTARTFTGTFYRDKATSIITLDANGDHLKFKLQDGSVKKLDKFGADEQGGPPENYILKKL